MLPSSQRQKRAVRILLIEDDATVAKSIQHMLSQEDFEVTLADLGYVGFNLSKRNTHDLIVLDLQLPDTTGIDILSRLRSQHIDTPVLVLSGNASPDVKVLALKTGADDHLTKPFHKDELIARARAVLRCASSHTNSLITTGKIVLDLDAKTVSVNGVQIGLTTKEYEILKLLSQRKGMTLSKGVILNQLYGGMDVPTRRSSMFSCANCAKN